MLKPSEASFSFSGNISGKQFLTEINTEETKFYATDKESELSKVRFWVVIRGVRVG